MDHLAVIGHQHQAATVDAACAVRWRAAANRVAMRSGPLPVATLIQAVLLASLDAMQVSIRSRNTTCTHHRLATDVAVAWHASAKPVAAFIKAVWLRCFDAHDAASSWNTARAFMRRFVTDSILAGNTPAHPESLLRSAVCFGQLVAFRVDAASTCLRFSARHIRAVRAVALPVASFGVAVRLACFYAVHGPVACCNTAGTEHRLAAHDILTHRARAHEFAALKSARLCWHHVAGAIDAAGTHRAGAARDIAAGHAPSEPLAAGFAAHEFGHHFAESVHAACARFRVAALDGIAARPRTEPLTFFFPAVMGSELVALIAHAARAERIGALSVLAESSVSQPLATFLSTFPLAELLADQPAVGCGNTTCTRFTGARHGVTV